MTHAAAKALRLPVRFDPVAWVLPEGTVPQSIPHDTSTQQLRRVLEAWAASATRPIRVAGELAVRWDEAFPRVGIDPDLCLLDPPPPGVESLDSLLLWKPGHEAPTLCIEVVSRNHPHKDYHDLAERYAHVGPRELIVFDPRRAGPRSGGGPVLLQIWRRDAAGDLERVHFSDEPGYSEVLGAWLHPHGHPQGGVLVIASDRAGEQPWLSTEERERAERKEATAELERERAAREALERRIAELEGQSR